MTAKSDTILVEAVLGGDKPAYGELYDRYAPLIRAICYDATKNLTEAQELAQEVFVRAYERLGELRNRELFSRWLMVIAQTCGKEWLRRQARHRQRHSDLDPEAVEGKSVADDGQIEELRSAITKLPEKERLALHTFYLQEKSFDDACRVLNLSRSGLYRVLDRARRRLEKLMSGKLEDIR